MLHLNFPLILSTSLIPLIVGFLYYSDKAFGKLWMRLAGLDFTEPQQGSMGRILGLALLLGLVLSIFFIPTVIHASHLQSLIFQPGVGPAEPGSMAEQDAQAFLTKYDHFRNFHHGVIHGIIAALTCVWPVIGINALFERRGWKYTAIHVGYWVITFALMGGVICAFA